MLCVLFIRNAIDKAMLYYVSEKNFLCIFFSRQNK